MVFLAAFVAFGSIATAAPPPPARASQVAPWVQITLGDPIGGFTAPVEVVGAGDGQKRLFVVQQDGLVRVVKDGKLLDAPFLDVKRLLGRAGGEQGLLGLAFHPKDKARAFIAYTDKDENDALAEVKDGIVNVLFSIPDFASNHNGGMLAFGPDGLLYMGTGDGGAAGDPHRNGQNPDARLGKMLQIDVDKSPTKPQVAWIGLRNPWRYSFDRQTGDMWIGDVGQDHWEEVDFVSKDDLGKRLNFGWSVVEGGHCFRPKSGCDATGMQAPVFEYPHGDDGCSVTGGYVYRGAKQPKLAGTYVVADYCSGRVWELKKNGDAFVVARALDSKLNIASFGEDDDGELWVVDYGQGAIRPILAK